MDPQFKHAKGPNGTLESICMECLLAVGIGPSEDDLLINEIEHNCKVSVDEVGLLTIEAHGKGER